MTSPRADGPDRVPSVGASEYLRSVLVPIHQDESGSIGLTVAIPAGIVRGHAVHPAVWLRRMAAEVRSRPGPVAGVESVAHTFESHAARRDDRELPTGALLSSINHIYLVDATITAASGVPATGAGTLWQVALADVSGWTIGAS